MTTLLALSACSSIPEKEGSSMDSSLEGCPVTITFSVPDVRIASPSTKSLEDPDDEIGSISSDVPYLDPDKLYVVVCGGTQSIKYIRKAEIKRDPVTGEPEVEIVSSSSIPGYPLSGESIDVSLYKFTVQLELTDSHRTVYFLGNIDESQLVTGSYSYQIFPALFSYPGKQAYWQSVSVDFIRALKDEHDQPVMVNGSYLPDEKTVVQLNYVPLIRNYAKIQVTNATAEEEEFELDSYAVIYYPKEGSVAPFRANAGNVLQSFDFNTSVENYRFSGYERCSFTDLDEGLEYPGYLAPGVEFDYTIPTDAMFRNPDTSGGRVLKYNPNDPDQGFYIYERGIPNATVKQPTFVIIRGRFGSEGKYYYYRLDLMEAKTVELETVYQYYPIYRNFRYTIHLNRISSVGVDSPEAAANSSGAEDISADVSMRHLSDISNGKTRLVVEPFMEKTYTGPNKEGYYYLYARFFDDLNSSDANTDWGAVSVELEPMGDNLEDILILYDDVGNEVHAFYPSSQQVDGENGFRIIRFNTKAAGNVTLTQKIKITGRDLYSHEEFPLYREVEISLQRKQPMTVTCVNPQIATQTSAKQEIQVTIPTGLPESMFPLEFVIEAEQCTLTPDNSYSDNNLPVNSGISISDNEKYAGKTTIQFIRTLTLDEYLSLPDPENDGFCTFSSYFKSNKAESATTVWVDNEYFVKNFDSFENLPEQGGHFWVKADETEDCNVVLNNGSGMQYKMDEGAWVDYNGNSVIPLDRGHKVSFRCVGDRKLIWNTNRFFCYKRETTDRTLRDGKFSVGGNLASLIMGDSFVTDAAGLSGDWNFIDFLNGHVNLTDASELILPMEKCSKNAYKSFFDGCTSLKKGPELPATTLGETCYRNMFRGCSSLEVAPYLPVTKLAKGCYQQMFQNCTSLTEIRINAASYSSNDFSNWVSNVSHTGVIWLNPAIRNSTGYEAIIPHGSGWEWENRDLPSP